jgi:hypothetical protein
MRFGLWITNIPDHPSPVGGNMPERRFPPVEGYRGISYIVRDANRSAVAYVYFESEPGRRAAANLMSKHEARKIAANIAKMPDLVKRPRRLFGWQWRSPRYS